MTKDLQHVRSVSTSETFMSWLMVNLCESKESSYLTVDIEVLRKHRDIATAKRRHCEYFIVIITGFC